MNLIMTLVHVPGFWRTLRSTILVLLKVFSMRDRRIRGGPILIHSILRNFIDHCPELLMSAPASNLRGHYLRLQHQWSLTNCGKNFISHRVHVCDTRSNFPWKNGKLTRSKSACSNRWSSGVPISRAFSILCSLTRRLIFDSYILRALICAYDEFR